LSGGRAQRNPPTRLAHYAALVHPSVAFQSFFPWFLSQLLLVRACVPLHVTRGSWLLHQDQLVVAGQKESVAGLAVLDDDPAAAAQQLAAGQARGLGLGGRAAGVGLVREVHAGCSVAGGRCLLRPGPWGHGQVRRRAIAAMPSGPWDWKLKQMRTISNTILACRSESGTSGGTGAWGRGVSRRND